MTDEELEEIQKARGLTAPRVSLSDLLANIAGEHYFTLEEATAGGPHPGFDTFTVCALQLRNGFIVLGYSAPASPENFDPAIGRKIAKDKAIDQVWPLMGYALRNDIARAAPAPVPAETHEFMGTEAEKVETDRRKS